MSLQGFKTEVIAGVEIIILNTDLTRKDAKLNVQAQRKVKAVVAREQWMFLEQVRVYLYLYRN